ncbi:hypothetical protein CPB83DRAFT_472504 [Crepidotus variabilis]|uniref:PIN domain-containing protein n=1 Tax=Crepidotus variabilis TaxID=179855 RepID=A0A9P6ER82_9AGAR|nr:hypothetical protein CPB83DRAFT_472504 [Crepidotus variabilis]
MNARKGKERDTNPRDPQPTDLAEKLTALRRRTAAATRPRDKSERDPPQPLMHKETDYEEFDRRLKISASSPPHISSSPKLYNPHTDPVPIRRTAEPEVMSDATGSSSQAHTRPPRGDARQLFDHRKDDPVRFSVLARPSQSNLHSSKRPVSKPSVDHVSASSASSYAASISSSTFTLSSTTDGSSASSALFDGSRPHQAGTEDSGNSVFSLQLKKLYRSLTNLETKIKQEDADEGAEDSGRNVVLKGKAPEGKETDKEKEKWKKQIHDHKELAETIHNLLEMSLSPSVPASLRNIPQKYNIIVRLWTYGFHKLLEALRRASFTSPLALEHLQDFIYYAYTFYTGLLEEPTLGGFKSGWLEALGDLARYRMAVCKMVGEGQQGRGGLTKEAVSNAEDSTKKKRKKGSSSSGDAESNAVPRRIDDSPSPSIGPAAARMMALEPEKELWRTIARDWFALGLADQPGTGKLHHHLGLLAREGEGEELRGVYHFVKSMTTLHPFSTSRESILPLFSTSAEKKAEMDIGPRELFVQLHGMLFTHIQMDDFDPTLARLMERLTLSSSSLSSNDLEERDWIMMAVINIGAILEYGRPTGVVRRVGGVGQPAQPGAPGGGAPGQQQAMQHQAAMRVMAKKAAAGVPGSVSPHVPPASAAGDAMDVDSEGHTPTGSGTELPHPLTLALTLTSRILSFVLQHPFRQISSFAQPTLNPYLTTMFTFLATMSKHRPTWDVLGLERVLEWNDIASFLSLAPSRVLRDQLGSTSSSHPQDRERWTMLTTSCSPPLPEDWCMRGMEWVGRKVFERGYWKSGEDKRAEIEVLNQGEGAGENGGIVEEDGTIEDDDEDDSGDGGYYGGRHANKSKGRNGGSSREASGNSELVRRWVRIIRCAVTLSNAVDGLVCVEDPMTSKRQWKIEGALKEKVEGWAEEERVKCEEEERRRAGMRDAEAMDVDMDEDMESEGSEDEENEDDSQEVRDLKARRRYLKSLLSQQRSAPSATPRRRAPRTRTTPRDPHTDLAIKPYYTTLVLDTNVLLTSLTAIASLISQHLFTVIVPLPVITELDGLSSSVPNPNTSESGEAQPSNHPELRAAAHQALEYIKTALRANGMVIKVQTTRGNYLSSLNIRMEEIDFASSSSATKNNMDDLILKAAIWQNEQWVDREGLLKSGMDIEVSSSAEGKDAATKVVLLTLDRNLRLKARSRQLPAANERDLAKILALAT